MKPLTEQVDEFIQNYFDGTYISGMADSMVVQTPTIADSLRPFVDDLTVLMQKTVPEYLHAPNVQEKERMADVIFNSVMNLRTFGWIRSNPFSLKELSFYKNRCAKLEKEIETLRATTKEAYVAAEKE